jgi:RNA polymerase sigma-70 factor (ECF subfamily)
MQTGAIHLEREVRAATRPSAEDAAELYVTYAARIRGYVAFRVRDPHDVDDLTADVFRRAVAGPVPADRAAWPAWLFRVAHNAVVDHYRRRRFPDPLGMIVERADDGPSLPDRVIRDERVRAAEVALREIPGRQRAAIYLRHYEGLPYDQVAAILGVPETTARSLVHRGLKRVATELDRTEVRR